MSKPKVLLAESSDIVLQIEKNCLKDAPLTIFTARDSEGALNTARKVRPDLIYLSLELHGAGGFSCCKTFKSDPVLQTIPVVMVCAAAKEELELSRAAGCDAVVAKPIDCREFAVTGLSLMPGTAPSGERIPCRAVVACDADGDAFFGSLEDISVSGMFIGSVRKIAAGEHLSVKFVLPKDGAVPIETAAQVNWVNGPRQLRNEHLPRGFGVLFRGLDADAREQIKEYMNLIKVQVGW
jgi:CheY-like chemotaxis protein